MKETEDRILNHLMQQIEEQGMVLNHKVDGIDQRVQSVENSARASASERKAKIIETN